MTRRRVQRGTVHRPDYMADCDECDWSEQSRTARAAGLRHHQKTGHTVYVEMLRTIVYKKPSA